MRRFFIRSCTGFMSALLLAASWADALPATSHAAAPPPPTTIAVQETPPASAAPDFIVTSIVGSALPQYIELFNQGDAPLHLEGWSVTFTIHDATPGGCADTSTSVSLPAGWMLSKKYVTLENTTTPSPGSLTYPFSLDSTTLLLDCLTPMLSQVALVHATDTPEQAATIPTSDWSATSTVAAQHRQRGNSLSSTRAITGIFDGDYKIVTGAITLNSDPLYAPPTDSASLQVLEVLPNARNCSPLETDPTCSDYIKLFNPTDQPINLALYRLRVGYKGQSESITNTFTWGKDLDPANDELLLPPSSYYMLAARNDGQPISVTDSGSFIWIEDAYGTATYEPIVEYPDASSTSNIGQAWAYNGTTWLWTSVPQPGAANYFPPVIVPPVVLTSVSVDNALKPCGESQYRSPLTNRCNTIAATLSSLAPCGESEERNPLTNRCRAIATISAELARCPEGSERNPATNRCRQIAAVAGASTTTATAVKDVAAPATEYAGWVVAALAILLAIGYGLYEWRQDLALVVVHGRERTRSMFKKLLRRE